MIYVNGNKIEFTSFPDGTTSFRYDPLKDPTCFDGFQITWEYDGDHECILLWYLVNHIRNCCGAYIPITLWMPYIPNARMDRVKSGDEVFTLKWFAQFLNSMRFDNVKVHDPHSNVSAALIDNIEVVPAHDCIEVVSDILNNEKGLNVLYCYPDEGAAKRYSEQICGEYVFGIKHRDWRSGKIERLELSGAEKVNGRNILIVDDICSRGGTFTHMAKALKNAGANEIFLYVTHCENTIENGSVLTDGMISHVFTTRSIYRGIHEKITVIDKGEAD